MRKIFLGGRGVVLTIGLMPGRDGASLNRTTRRYQFDFAETPIFGQVQHQDNCAHQDDQAPHH
jgi:hypothetical protein